jgi:hapalindole-type alkaloid chlorinase
MTFLSIRHAHHRDVEQVRGALQEIRSGSLGGVVLHGVYTSDELARINGALDARAGAPPTTQLPGFEGDATPPFLYGHSLMSTGEDLHAYLRDAARMPPALDEIFSGTPPFLPRLERIVRVLADDRPVACAETADGQLYAPCTIRELPDGHEIGLHIGNAFLCLPQARELARRVSVDAQISFFMPLRRPEAGGELVITDLRWPAVAASYAERTDSVGQLPGVTKRLAGLLPQQLLDPPAGALVVFDGGRFFHRVAPVRGPTPRRTIGGFLAWEQSADAIRYWS